MSALAPPRVTPADRFGMALCLAILFHAVLILGIGFAPEAPLAPRHDAMEVILVQQRSAPDEEAEFLAQADLAGGGDSEDSGRPATPLASPLPELSAEPATAPIPAADPVRVEQPTDSPAPAQRAATPEVVEQPRAEVPAQLAAAADHAEQPAPAPQQESAGAEAAAAGHGAREQPSRPAPSASELIASSFAIASLSAEIQQKLDARANRPRRKFISASTREYRYAAYMEAWRAKVERVGNINYPDEARRAHLSGSLILEVVLQPDGSVKEVIVRRSSGHPVLDDAARRIVELAAPFAPFPDDIAADTDLLHVTRTWQFLDSNRFSSR